MTQMLADVMVSTYCAGLLLVIAGCSLKVCPFFYRTSRGLLCLHWTLINFLVSTSGSHAIDSNCLLISLATFLCLLEHRVTIHKAESLLSSAEQVALGSFLFSLDAACFMYGQIATVEISLILLLSHLTLLLFVVFYQDGVEERKLSTQELLHLGSIDLFSDPKKPFAFLGLSGLHYAVVVLSILVQIPWLNGSRLLTDLIYLSRSLGTLSMILTPAYLGGFIHFLKSGGGASVLPPPSRASSEVFNA